MKKSHSQIKSGYFEFLNLPKGNFTLSVFHPEFDSLDTLIAVGNQWKYYFIKSGYTDGGSYRTPGLIQGDILKRSGEYPNWKFNVSETYYDSIDGTTKSANFDIQVVNTDTLNF